MPAKNDSISKGEFGEAIGNIMEKLKKLDKIADQLDWFFGKYKKLDEEQTLLSKKVSDHDDRIEKAEKKLGIYAN
jgi:hypothetical protein